MQYLKIHRVSLFLGKIITGAGLGLLVLAFVSLNNTETWEEFWQNKVGWSVAILLGFLSFLISDKINSKFWKSYKFRKNKFSSIIKNIIWQFLCILIIVTPVFLIVIAHTSKFVVDLQQEFSLYKVFTDWYNNRGTTGVLTILGMIILYNLLFLLWHSFLSFQKNAIETERLKRQQLESEFAVLKSQISPHFLFNSLNVLSSIVHKNEEEAETFIRKLSDIFQYVLSNSTKDKIALEQEINFIQSYLYLLKVRFRKSLNFKIDIHPSSNVGKIPPLTLQILVENAIKHNEVSQDNPLHIDISQKNNYVIVSNNLQKRMYQEESLHIGLKNLEGRFSFFTDLPMKVEESQDAFIVQVPLIHH